MKKILMTLALVMTTQAWGQMYTPSASEVSEKQAQDLFTIFKEEDMKMKERSECFDRAYMWSMRADRVHKIKTEKVFLFFTRKFEMAKRVTTWYGKPFKWWFHVAPAVRVNGELKVLDATFTEKPETVQGWADNLMKDPEPCIELTNFEDFVVDRNKTAQFQCYYMSAPQYVYGPLEMGLRDEGSVTYTPGKQLIGRWTEAAADWSVKAYGARYRKEVRKALRFE